VAGAGVVVAAASRRDDRRDAGERDEEIDGVDSKTADGEKNGRFASVEDARKEKGDMWSQFRYIL